jgi:hypothetical protein
MLDELASLFPRPSTTKERRMQIFDRMKHDIATQGFTVMAVFPSEVSPGFAYTIGLSESTGHPELLLFALPMQAAHVVLGDLATRIKAGERFSDGDVINEVLNLPVAVKSISHQKASEYTVQLFNMYPSLEAPPPVVQLVLPDPKGKFPWAEDFDEKFRTMQPALWKVIH